MIIFYREGDLPAHIEYYYNGQLEKETWFKNGQVKK